MHRSPIMPTRLTPEEKDLTFELLGGLFDDNMMMIYIYIYIYTYTHTHTHTYIYTYTYI
jgi:hypothetical protein